MTTRVIIGIAIIIGVVLISRANADCWQLPSGRGVLTTVGSTPPVKGARRIPCGNMPGKDAPAPGIKSPAANGFMAVKDDKSDRTGMAPAPAKPVKPSITKVVIGNFAGECVEFARSKVPSLPHGLNTFKDKLSITNSATAVVGSIAIIGFTTGEYVDVGHVAVVESVSENSITIIEAHFTNGKITRRTAVDKTLKDAELQLKIKGYFVP